MANVVAVKIRPRKDRVPSGANLAHNSGMTKASYWMGDGSDIAQSHKYNSRAELNEDWQKWIDEANKRYEDNPNTKIKLRSQAVRIEEGMIIIGTDVQANKEDIINITKDFIKEFEKQNNTKVRHWAFHDHEGHKNEDTEHINRHVHFLFDNVSKDGEIIRSKWKKDYLSKLQDTAHKVAIKYTPVTRARNTIGQGIRGKHHREYRKEQETKEATNKKYLATQADLKAEIKTLRAELQANGATREDYAKLEATVKDLKKQIKSKDLTIEDLHKVLQGTKTIQDELDTTKEALKASNENNEYLKIRIGRHEAILLDFGRVYKEAKKIHVDLEPTGLLKKIWDWAKRLVQDIGKLEEENEELTHRLELSEKENKALRELTEITCDSSENKADESSTTLRRNRRI